MLPLIIESWIWYGVATTITLMRFVARVIHFGHPKHLLVDDYLMMLALAFYTTEVVTMNIVAKTSSNLIPAGWFQTHTLTAMDRAERVFGSKLILVVEQSQCATIWLIKGCLLVMYYRITVGSFRKQNIAVKVLIGYVIFTFIFMEIFYFAVWCRPFHDYWAVPTPHIQCSAATNHLITNAVFNLTSDVAMIAIALPMFIRSNLPTKRKLVLCMVFSLGLFVIVAAVLNKYYSFTQPFGSLWTYWYIRECSTAMIVANLPFTWPLVRKVCGAKSFNGESPTRDNYHEHSMHKESISQPPPTTRRSSKGAGGGKLGFLSSLVKGKGGDSDATRDGRDSETANGRLGDLEKGGNINMTQHTAPSSSAAGSGGGDSSHAILGKEDALCFGLLDDEDFEDTYTEGQDKETSDSRDGATPPTRFRSSISKGRWGSVARDAEYRARVGPELDDDDVAGADVPDVPPLPEFGVGVPVSEDGASERAAANAASNTALQHPRPILDKAVLSPSRRVSGESHEAVSPLS